MINNTMYFSGENIANLELGNMKYEQNNTARKKIYQILDSLVLENSPIIPLYYDKVMRFSQMNIEGLTTNPVNQLNLKKVYKK